MIIAKHSGQASQSINLARCTNKPKNISHVNS